MTRRSPDAVSNKCSNTLFAIHGQGQKVYQTEQQQSLEILAGGIRNSGLTIANIVEKGRERKEGE